MTEQIPRQVVLLMTDSTRWDMLGSYRDSGILTPHLDDLAATGTQFDRAYTTAPVCTPARSALFTGTWPHTNGAWANGLTPGLDVPTIGQRCRDAAIETAYIGKWHLDGSDYFGTGVCPDGWNPDYWYDMRNYLEALSPDERRASRDDRTSRESGFPSELTFAHRVSDRAVEFLQAHEGLDFLLVVSYDEPHDPGITPREVADKYSDYVFPDDPNVRDDLSSKPKHQRVWAAEALSEERGPDFERRDENPFAAQEFVDAQIGRVLDAIDDHAPDALAIYTSDHGLMLNSHRLWGKGPAMYDEIARIPLLARLRGTTTPNSLAPHPVSHIDVAPTILEHLNVPIPELMAGKSLRQVLRDPDHRTNDFVFVEFGRYEVDNDGFGGFQPMRGVFDGRHKLVVNLLSSDELYDLETDPGELRNLIDDANHCKVRDALHDALLAWMNESRDPLRGYHWGRRPWRSDAPEANWSNDSMTRQRPGDPQYMPALLDYTTGLEPAERTRFKAD